MQSYEQIYIKKTRIKKVVDLFLNEDQMSINKISKILGVSYSTVQRDLNDFEYIQMLYADRSREVLEQKREKLKKNIKRGLSNGGVNSTTVNEPIREENGKFIGNKKR